MNESEHEIRHQNGLAYWERRREENANIGWYEILDEVECEELFDRLKGLLPCEQPNLPPPSVTWNVSAACRLRCRSPEQRALRDDLHHKVLQALRRTQTQEPWYVFGNYQHSCYRLHVTEMPDHVADWPVEILPYGDPCYLLAADSSSGLIAVLRESITVFGNPLLSYVQHDLPVAFAAVPPRR